MEEEILNWTPEQKESFRQACEDVLSIQLSANEYVMALARAIGDSLHGFGEAFSRAGLIMRSIRRQEKIDRKTRRRAYFTTGKHGMKRPKGRRNA